MQVIMMYFVVFFTSLSSSVRDRFLICLSSLRLFTKNIAVAKDGSNAHKAAKKIRTVLIFSYKWPKITKKMNDRLIPTLRIGGKTLIFHARNDSFPILLSSREFSYSKGRHKAW